MTLPSILLLAAAAAAQSAASSSKVEVVSVTGCLREQGAGNWMVVAATDAVPSIANQAQGDDIPKTPPAGKNTYKLIGVGEFGLPAHRDHTVVARGLLVKDSPVSRLNLTSLVEAVAACTPGAPK